MMRRRFSAIVVSIAVISAVQADEVNLFKPYTGKSVSGVDTTTLSGKVMCGYQGWFNCEGDGAGVGWVHWGGHGRDMPGPGHITVDLWPDVSEYDADELYDTGFRFNDGSVARLFSSHNRKTVLRHFEWMRDYGIDGAFIQRFASILRQPDKLMHQNAVLAHAREGANLFGRTYAVMYDLSGLRENGADLIINDWKKLRDKAHITEDPAYLHHNGKPVVSVWGVGFTDRRGYTLDDCRRIIQYLKNDGCTVKLGVPPTWEKQGLDTINDEGYLDVLKLADILSPWAVGRFGSVPAARAHAARYYPGDTAFCKKNGLEYMPVVFPGFSWHNIHRGRRPLGEIPRLKGKFMWEQIRLAKEAGFDMIYVAMFDEVDEGTAIFKCTNTLPDGGDFLTYEGLPSDFYLRLTGYAGKVLRDEIPLTDDLPEPLQKMVDSSKQE